jgi:hypothetical protein
MLTANCAWGMCKTTAHGEGVGSTRQQPGSRQTALWPRKVSPSTSGRRCPLYFAVHRFSAHVIALDVGFQRCTRHRFVAVACFVVWSSPCTNARQTIRRVFVSFRRVLQAHGIGRISGNAPTMLLHIMHEYIECCNMLYYQTEEREYNSII